MSSFNKYGLFGKFIAIEGKEYELSTILEEAASLMKKVRGCRVYLVGHSKENSQEVWVYEVWNSKEDHDNSLSVQGVKELIARAMPLLASPPEKGIELDMVGGLGL